MARASKFNVSVDGAKEIESALRAMGDDAADLIDKAVKAGGAAALSFAKNTSSFHDRTGYLRQNIRLYPIVKKLENSGGKYRPAKGSIKLGFYKFKPRGGGGGKKKDAFYGSFLELGTKHISARYFLRDAVDKHKETIANIVTATLLRLLRRW